VPNIVGELSGKCQGISQCLETGHPVYYIQCQMSSLQVMLETAEKFGYSYNLSVCLCLSV